MENPDDWQCPCGFTVWARKDFCLRCKEPRAEGDWAEAPNKGQAVKEQEALTGGQVQPPQQTAGTEGGGDAAKADNVKKRSQLKFIAKTIAHWPEDAKDSEIFRSLQKEAEDLKTALVSEQPTDMQLLNAQEE
eukprot:6455754-Heterocapsa_arctica.AAC.1